MIGAEPAGLTSATYGLAFLITFYFGYYVYSQRLTRYQIIRSFLSMVYIVILFIMALDLFRILLPGGWLSAYPVIYFSLALVEAVLLLSAAVGMHLRPGGSTYGVLFSDLRTHRNHLVVFLFFVLASCLAVAYLGAYRPYTLTNANLIFGAAVASVEYAQSFTVLIGLLFVFFLAYPVALLSLAAIRTKDARIRRGLIGLPIGWAGTSAIFVISSILLAQYGEDATPVAYVILALFFGAIARNFMRSAVLAGFVESVPAQPSPRVGQPTGERSPMPDLVGEKVSLIEVDTGVEYEGHLRSLAGALASGGKRVFVISTRASRVYKALSPIQGLRFFTMSSGTRMITPSDREGEVLLPLYDPSILLDAIDRTIGQDAQPKALVFDSLSDMVVYVGFDDCYKFLKLAIELLSHRKVTALFISFSGAHDERSSRVLKSLFASQLRIGAEGVKATR
jgi:hypothetical protein